MKSPPSHLAPLALRLNAFRSSLLGLGFALAACGSSQANVAGTTAKHAAAAPASACESYTARLCAELGAETLPCVSLRNSRAWFSERSCQVALADIDDALTRVRGLRADCETFSQKVCAELGEDSPHCDEVKRGVPQVPPGHCPRLLESYPKLMADLRAQEQRSKPLSAQAWESLLAGDPASLGPADAKVTIVEFSDFQCPYCAQAHQTVHQLRKRYPDQVRVIFRHFPLAFHEHARLAAAAALAAQAQGKFWPFHDRLFERQDALDRKSLEGYAQELGMDLALFKKDLDERTHDARIEADMALGRSVRVDGTPTMFVNGRRAENATDADAVAPLIDAALAGR